jgi:urease accessory protein
MSATFQPSCAWNQRHAGKSKEQHMARVLKTAALTTALFGAFTVTASAHTGVGATMGFAHGFLHPLTGLDHVAAMFAVGLLAVRLGSRALWAVPLMFVSFMAVGGALGLGGVMMPAVELIIMLSAAVFAVMVLAPKRFPVALAMVLTGFVAIAHGMAHGAEMPESASGFLYGAGFVLVTALLHCAGIAAGFALGFATRRPALDKG